MTVLLLDDQNILALDGRGGRLRSKVEWVRAERRTST